MKEKQTQAQQVKIILQELKDNKIPASTVESDLKFPSGILWKVKTSFVPKGCPGPLELSEERLNKLIEYRDKKLKKAVPKGSVSKKIAPVVRKAVIANHKINQLMPKGLSLAAQLEWREKNGG